MIEELVTALGVSVGVPLPVVRVSGGDPVLPSVYRLGALAAASIGAATAAAAAHWHGDRPAPEVTVDVRHAAVAFQSERHFRIDGRAMDPWAPLSGDYRTSDGWVRLHCNFAHHRDAALRALRLPAEARKRDVVRACASRHAADVEEAVLRQGGCAAAMRSRAEWLAHPQARAVASLPVVRLQPIAGDEEGRSPQENDGSWDERGREREGKQKTTSGSRRADGSGGEGASWTDARDGSGGGHRGGGRRGSGKGVRPLERPLSGVRVLDLTRVIAGPVAGRALAAHGADVLRVGADHLPEVPGLVVETAFGKRSCHVDLRSAPGTLRELVREADVIIQAYRPGALRGKGFGPGELAGLRPGIVCVEISAYGSRGPWAHRRGFDSLVQMATGIAHENGDGTRPSPLPVQALDHATGHLAAFGAIAALLRRRAEGGSWHVEVSLARTAAWLEELGRIDGGRTPAPSADGLLATMDSAFGTLTYVRPPGHIEGAPPHWSSPPPRQGEHPAAWVT